MIKKYLSRITNLSIKQQMFAGFGLTIVLLAVIAIMSVFILSKTKRAATNVTAKHQPTVIKAFQLSESLKKSNADLGLYLLSKNKIHEKNFKKELIRSVMLLRELKEQDTVKSDPEALRAIQQIEADMQAYHSYKDRLLTLAKSDRRNFPGMSYATNHINPLSRQILSGLAIMIDIEEGNQNPRPDLLKLLNELRYDWSRVMNSIRAFLGYRSRYSMNEYTNFITEYNKNLTILKKKFGADLSFEQEDMLKKILYLNRKFKKNKEEMYRIHGSDKWRQDTYIIRNDITPILNRLDREIGRFTSRQLKNIKEINNDLISQANTTTMMIVMMLGIAVVAVLLLWFVFLKGIINPMRHVVDAGIDTFRKLMGVIADQDGSDMLQKFDTKDVSKDAIRNLTMTFELMAEALEQAVNRQQESTALLNEKVEKMLVVIQKAAAGDLTAQLDFVGDEAIDQLAQGIQVMLDRLNELVDKIQDAGSKVTASAEIMASIGKEHEATVTEQAASTNEVMATVSMIDATTQELVETMDEVSAVADSTAHSASDSLNALEVMAATMQQMSDATEAIYSKLSVLNEKASNISNVVTTINRVADQTNLLSLNAAIEAEKAGEFGRGFAVVATEIRRLADQTAVATWDIEQMVKEMQSSVSTGVMAMEKFSEEVEQGVGDVNKISKDLANIILQVQALSPKFEAVSNGMKSQSRAASQINESMVQLNEIAHETASSLHDSNKSVKELTQAATALQDSVSRFKVRLVKTGS